MSTGHVALLVEDDLDMAEELGELLESLGHDHIHAASQMEAIAILRSEKQFCYVLLDLQIKVRPTGKPLVEAGHHLLEVIRETYPLRNSSGEHCLQILLMSGHAKDKATAITTMQNGGDDFLDKPLSLEHL